MSGRVPRRIVAVAMLAALASPVGPAACKPERPAGRIAEATVAPSKPEKAREWVVARIGDREITYGEMDDVLETLPVFVRMRYQAPERRRDFLEAYVQYVVLALAAESEGYGKDPVVLERLKGDLVDRFLRDRVDLKVKTTDIPEDAIVAYYQAHPFEFHAPERRRIAHILLPDRATADKIAFRVRKTMEDSNADPREEFSRFAARLSTDAATKDSGGDLGLFPRDPDSPAGVPQAVIAAAATLSELFQVSGVVEAPDGFHVLFWSATVPPIDETLDQARPRIVERLMDVERTRLRDALRADLESRAGVKVNEDVASKVAAEFAAETAKARAAAAARPVEGGAP